MIQDLQSISKTEFRKHLSETHHKTVLNTHLKEIVYGGIDGIITTFAIVAGFTGASVFGHGQDGIVLPMTVVLIFGFANLLADGFSMGVGEFLSARAQKKLYEKEYAKERSEIKNNVAYESAESVLLFEDHGFSHDDALQLVDIYKRNPTYWTDFMMRYELNMAPPDPSPFKNAMMTFASFIIFGFLPLLAYLIGIPQADTFVYSAFFAIVALVFLSALRARVTHENAIQSIVEIVVLGVIAGSIAYTVGVLLGS